MADPPLPRSRAILLAADEPRCCQTSLGRNLEQGQSLRVVAGNLSQDLDSGQKMEKLLEEAAPRAGDQAGHRRLQRVNSGLPVGLPVLASPCHPLAHVHTVLRFLQPPPPPTLRGHGGRVTSWCTWGVGPARGALRPHTFSCASTGGGGHVTLTGQSPCVPGHHRGQRPRRGSCERLAEPGSPDAPQKGGPQREGTWHRA